MARVAGWRTTLYILGVSSPTSLAAWDGRTEDTLHLTPEYTNPDTGTAPPMSSSVTVSLYIEHLQFSPCIIAYWPTLLCVLLSCVVSHAILPRLCQVQIPADYRLPPNCIARFLPNRLSPEAIALARVVLPNIVFCKVARRSE